MDQSRLVEVAEKYLPTLLRNDAAQLISLAGSQGIIEDPRFPGINGAEAITGFVEDFNGFFASMSPRVEHLRTTATPDRVLCEDILHLDTNGEHWELPVGTVVADAESEGSARIHVYYTQWPLNKAHSFRRNLFDDQQPNRAEFSGAVLNYVQSLLTGDLERIRDSFEADVYFREASGPPYTHWGRNAVVDYFKGLFSRGAPMLRDDTVNDDGRTVFMQFSVVGWNGEPRSPDTWEAGLAAYERSRDGRLSGIRIYDDVAF